ncbi:hypothetical protein EHM69_01385 [candidate division KSB1 bacterium]|nr:MAG: hypothetical protein EHM69_01385 [candidate division KSB1 bacterium]
MLHQIRVYIVAALALALVGIYWGCDRLTGDEDTNQLPTVYFVNVPLDSSVFNYAPVVHWMGYDPDGMVVGYQYHDDSTQAAIDAYNAGDEALRNYINGLPASAWVQTYLTSDTIRLRRTEQDSITQHIFMVRCIDNQNSVSPVKVRTFFRTNNPPNTPRVKWALDVELLNPLEFRTVYNVPDTLFWNDTTTATYTGISFLWQGTDPDSRELNIIQLEFSWLLVVDRTDGTTDTLPHPVYDDSSRVTGFASGWSPWNAMTQVNISGWFADSAWCMANMGQTFDFDGSYRFLLKVRDDGLTEADTVAMATFRAVRPVFDKQLLLIDWNRSYNLSRICGGQQNADLTAFYNQVVEEGLELAEQVRQVMPFSYQHDPILYNDDQVHWLIDNDIFSANLIPYDYIRRFKWIWIIADNVPCQNMDPAPVHAKLRVLMDYMDVGGNVMISGRSIFGGIFQLPTGPLAPGLTRVADTFFRNYVGLSTITAKPRYDRTHPDLSPADFAGANTTDQFLRRLEIDTAIVRSVLFGGTRLSYLPEVDYFGRSTGQTGFDYSLTQYNYFSSTSNQQYDTANVDCAVLPPTSASVAYLSPDDDSIATTFNTNARILDVTRVYNVTRGVYGEFMWVDQSNGRWRIVVSTPAQSGIWTTADELQVDYSFIPVDPSHDQPVSTFFNRNEGLINFDPNTGQLRIWTVNRFRAALFTFPLSFIKNDELVSIPIMPGFTVEGHPVGILVAYQTLAFNTIHSGSELGGQ